MLDLSFLKNSCPFAIIILSFSFRKLIFKQIKQGNAYFRNSVIMQ